MLKTSGLCDYLRDCLNPRGDITVAFIFGSIAAGTDSAASDIDLLVIGTIGLRALSGVLGDFKATVSREVNPHCFSNEEFLTRKRAGEHFIASILSTPKLFVKGTAHDLAEMV